MARLRRALEHADLVRLDHFRGFAAYWAIPADAEDARSGSWRPGPGPGLFDKLLEALGSLPLIAEDLGTIDEPVRDLQRRFALPGMLVQQFAYDGQLDNDHLSFRATPNTVIYTGTHDSDTRLVGGRMLPSTFGIMPVDIWQPMAETLFGISSARRFSHRHDSHLFHSGFRFRGDAR